MKIVILVEGKTETAFKPYLQKYLETRLHGAMPKLKFIKYDGRIPSKDKLKRIVETNIREYSADHVIALTDVYTGTNPPDFKNAEDAKTKMRDWVGADDRFHPHAAQYEFEAWLLPYWETIQKLAGRNTTAPGGAPEAVNHGKPPSSRIVEIFETGNSPRGSYNKVRDAKSILEKNDLSIAINQCPELKSFINTILEACNGTKIP